MTLGLPVGGRDTRALHDCAGRRRSRGTSSVSWFVMPALFGLVVAMAVRLGPIRAAIVTAFSGVAYQLALWAGLLLRQRSTRPSRLPGGNGSTGGWSFVLPACCLGVLLICAALAPWHRPSLRDLGATVLAGAGGAGVFLALLARTGLLDGPSASVRMLLGIGYAFWQVVVGVVSRRSNPVQDRGSGAGLVIEAGRQRCGRGDAADCR